MLEIDAAPGAAKLTVNAFVLQVWPGLRKVGRR
jgi:hypothetical protein